MDSFEFAPSSTDHLAVKRVERLELSYFSDRHPTVPSNKMHRARGGNLPRPSFARDCFRGTLLNCMVMHRDRCLKVGPTLC